MNYSTLKLPSPNDYLEASIHGDYPANVVTALKGGADPNACTRSGVPFIVYAAHHQRTAGIEIVKLLASSGANIAATDASGQNALMIACSQGKPGLVDTLLSLGAPLDNVDNDGWSALMLASCCVRYSSKDCARALIDAGCNVNFASFSGKNTALMLFTDKSQPEVVEALLKAGARTDVRDASGRRPYHVAKLALLKPSYNDIFKAPALSCCGLIEQAERVHDAEIDLEIMVAPAAKARPARRL
jgi:ankyrin repeat protein